MGASVVSRAPERRVSVPVKVPPSRRTPASTAVGAPTASWKAAVPEPVRRRVPPSAAETGTRTSRRASFLKVKVTGSVVVAWRIMSWGSTAPERASTVESAVTETGVEKRSSEPKSPSLSPSWTVPPARTSGRRSVSRLAAHKTPPGPMVRVPEVSP